MRRTSPVVLNLLIINILFFGVTYLSERTGNDWMTQHLALYYPASPDFHWYQYFTHMFMHGGVAHIFFNMYALWMFGTPIEQNWGGKRFLFYYLFCGLGAAALHTFVNFLIFNGMQADITAFANTPSPELFKQFIDAHANGFNPQFVTACRDLQLQWEGATADANSYAAAALEVMQRIQSAMTGIPTVGASGAIFGLLLAFGMMYPNVPLMIMFVPIPIKAKWFVLIYGGIELALGLSQPGSSIAHFAHVGGMLFGFLLIRFWIAQSRRHRY